MTFNFFQLFFFSQTDEVWNNFGEDQYDNYNEMYAFNQDISVFQPHQLNKSDNKEEEEDENIASPAEVSVREKSLLTLDDEETTNESLPAISKTNRLICLSNIDEESRSNATTPKPTYTCEKKQKFEAPITPMPSYVSMNTPNLRDELKRFGIKALPKKQAVKKLVEIYEFTHKNKLKRSASCMDFKTAALMQDKTDAGGHATNKTGNKLKKSESNSNFTSNNPTLSGDTLKKDKPVKKLSKKTVSDVAACSSSQTGGALLKIGAKSCKKKAAKSNDMTIVEQLNELEAEDSESDNSESTVCTQTKGTKRSKNLDEAELREAVHAFIRGDEATYLNVLNYVPLDIECIHAQLQATLAPRRCNNKLLMKVLDEFCVTFTLKNVSTRTHQGKLKAKKKN